ncbi:DNA-binding transcriptional regulator BolA [Buchnera aphidicola (Sipha maydis)]|uniref:BolA family protein n=1 Tax=Buchnera aphidicola TaxID=9 RepID=UPI0025429B5C|nr:BolA family protein [Buchnera aphidicola]WII23585.1 BolA family transcriptional regulator [Buchnera aphidicola (Sipha maydis)]
MILKIIQNKIKNKINTKYIKITNTSFMHKSFNKNSHFQIIIVSKDFEKINILRRHQIIYNILSQEIKKIIHGIEIFAYSIKEWKIKKKKIFRPIKCVNLKNK